MSRKIKLTEVQYLYADRESLGFCLECGEPSGYCEPDAENYQCESCGKARVFGAAQLLIMGRIDLVDTPEESSFPRGL